MIDAFHQSYSMTSKNLLSFSYPTILIREAHDLRLAHCITSEITEKTKLVLIGFPFDEGVKINSGIPGAKNGPKAIREQLGKMIATESALNEQIADIGDIDCEGKSVEEAQELLGTLVSELLEENLFPIILGGGHETSFGHFLGYVKANQELDIINLDAHTDVRELIDGKAHSGSPFRQAIEHESEALKGYHVIGAKRNRVAKEHALYVQENGSLCYSDEKIGLPKTGNSILLTIDLDVFDCSVMPGVSARNSNGFGKNEGLRLIKNVIQTGKVRSIDVVELNPEQDENGISALFAAELVYLFLE